MAHERGLKEVKSYADLQADAMARWRAVAKAKSEQQAALMAWIAEQPDVKDAPKIGSQWENELILCPQCTGHVYTVRRWACVNGKRYSTEVECIACHHRNTWSFEQNRWLVN